MTDEIALNRAASKGSQAQRLLDDELLQEVYAKREADLIAGWIGSRPDDVAGRESCWLALHANRKHREYLANFVSDGKLANAEFKQLSDAAERERKFGMRVHR